MVALLVQLNYTEGKTSQKEERKLSNSGRCRYIYECYGDKMIDEGVDSRRGSVQKLSYVKVVKYPERICLFNSQVEQVKQAFYKNQYSSIIRRMKTLNNRRLDERYRMDYVSEIKIKIDNNSQKNVPVLPYEPIK